MVSWIACGNQHFLPGIDSPRCRMYIYSFLKLVVPNIDISIFVIAYIRNTYKPSRVRHSLFPMTYLGLVWFDI